MTGHSKTTRRGETRIWDCRSGRAFLQRFATSDTEISLTSVAGRNHMKAHHAGSPWSHSPGTLIQNPVLEGSRKLTGNLRCSTLD